MHSSPPAPHNSCLTAHPLVTLARSHRNKWVAVALLVGLSLANASVEAQTTASSINTSASASSQESEQKLWLLSDIRQYSHRFSYSLAETVDGWFGDKPFAENGGKVSGHWRFNTLWDRVDGFDGNVRFRLRAELPNLKDRAYVYFGQDNERELVTDQPENFSRQQLLLRENRRQDQKFFAGLGLNLKENIDFRLGVRGGLNFYAQARYRDEWYLTPRDRVAFRQTLFWTVKESFGATSVLDYEHTYNPSLVLRWSTTGTITRRSHGFEWYSAIGPFKTLNERQMIGLEALVQGETGAVDISNYGLRATYQQHLYQDWLIGTFTLGHMWKKKDDGSDRKNTWALGFSLDLRF